MSQNQQQIKYTYGILEPPPVLFQTSNNKERISPRVKGESNLSPSDLKAKIVERVEYSNNGIFAYYAGHLHPAKGFPYPDILYKLNAVKRTILSLMKVAVSFPAIVFIAPLLLSKRFIAKSIEYLGIEYAYAYLEPIFFKEEFLCKSAKAIKYALVKAVKKIIKPKYWTTAFQLVEVIVAIIEFDNSYRFRFQDIAAEINKAFFAKNPSREIARLFKIAGDREKRTNQLTYEEQDKPGMIRKYEMMVKFVKVLLFVKPDLKRIVQEFIKHLDLEMASLDVDDVYWCLYRSDYNYGGISFRERWELRNYLHKNNMKLDEYLKNKDVVKII